MATSDGGCGKPSRNHNHQRGNKHHIFPSKAMEREGNPFKELQKGNGGNLAHVCEGCHEEMNVLFGGHATPLEILDFLVNRMWKGQTFWLELYLNPDDQRGGEGGY